MKNPIDQKIFNLIEILKANGDIRFKKDFCEAADLSKQHLRHIETETNHFTPIHILNIIKAYKVNANWIFGMSDEIFINQFKKANEPKKVNA